ncbi:MAG: ABC transporter ATP-binding protein [Christensenellales bacterium]|jgi:ATP-binding cassette subfamily B multidrug efflux pump
MFKLLKYIKAKQYILFALMAVFIVLQVYAELKVPELFSKLINTITTSTTFDSAEMTRTALIMLGYIVATLLIYFVITYLMAKFSATVAQTFRKVFYEKVMSLSQNEVKNFSPSSLITRTTNDISNIERFFSQGLRIFLTAPIMAGMAIVKILNADLNLTLGTIAAVMVLVITITVIFLVAIPKFKKIQTLLDKLNLTAKESLTGIKDIRAFNKEGFHSKRFDEVAFDITKTSTFIDKVMSLLDPMIVFVLNSLVLFIYWFGAYLASKNVLNIGDILAFSQYATMILFSLTSLTFVLIMLPRASVSAKRVNEVMTKEPSVIFNENIEKNASKSTKNVVLEFKNVFFKYPGAKDDVLYNVSFNVKRGETVAFIGSTGSGKSTLVNLIPRLYDATEGQIFVDGKNIMDYSQKELINKISYAPQKAFLFKGTIKSNLLYGNENATDEEIIKALEVAQAKNFVLKYEDGIDHDVAQGATNFSGGQKQRLSIARVLIKKSDILIFDNSFSALDFKTDQKLRKAISKNFADATKIIVAQRVGTIMDADKIIVLENGKVVGMGTHSQLIKNNKIYKEIAVSQLGEDALKGENDEDK